MLHFIAQKQLQERFLMHHTFYDVSTFEYQAKKNI